MAQSICFYFQVHQPYRIGRKSLLYPEKDVHYFDGSSPFGNKEVFEKVARKCYLPMTDLLIELIHKNPQFHVSFSLSGVFLEQCLDYGPIGKAVLERFQTLAATGRVEFLGETYYHSLSFLYSKAEFAEQVLKHHQIIRKLLGVSPKVFRNTELIYNNELATCIHRLGYDGIVAEGWPSALPDDNPNLVRYATEVPITESDKKILKEYAFRDWTGLRPKKSPHLNVLTKNFQLSDDMAFRFGDKNWSHHPLHTNTYADWVLQAPGDTVNLFMDYETFGEHQWEDTGIFEFFRHLPEEAHKRGILFRTPSQTIKDFEPRGHYSTHHFVSWADESRDISAWLENDMQRSAYEEIMELEKLIFKHRHSVNPKWKKIWNDFRKLQTSDHLYYMSTKYWADGDVHTYFSPYSSPYDAYINFMNVFEHLKERVKEIKS